MNETAILVIGVVVVLLVVIWILRLAAGLVLWFTAFVMDLHPLLAVLMFILFPPTLIVFLVGLAFIRFGVNAALEPRERSAPEKPRLKGPAADVQITDDRPPAQKSSDLS